MYGWDQLANVRRDDPSMTRRCFAVVTVTIHVFVEIDGHGPIFV
jgi:hypothetical protein